MNWTQLRVTVPTEDIDRTAAIMSMLDNGILIEDYSDIETGLKTVYGDLIDENILSADKSHGAVSIYIPDDKNYADYTAFLKERFAAEKIDAKMELLGVDEEEWSTAWKKYYHPIKVGEKLVIVPMWEKYEPTDGEIIVRMDPGMAFGTGTHETTRLVCGLIEKYLVPGQRMLDVGTGSGILAICASKLGAGECFAYDIDPVAVRVARENVKDNELTNITCGVSDLLRDVDISGGQFDFAVANIVADIIIRMSGDIGAYIKQGAYLITSGIIERYADDVRTAMLANGFELVETRSESDWVAMVYRKL
ncbi:MAG: 50S ribosomal protein L11 methyltransferase [Clostridiales bacterium]|nr:50S ribosomal protein L11 methyltransferase [Clostridiales bacterium]